MEKKRNLKRIINSNIAYEILDNSKAGSVTWQEGGCWILAEALSKYFNEPMYVVFNITKHRVEHFVVKHDNEYLDSLGMRTENQVIKDVLEFMSIKHKLMLIKYNSKMNTDGIIRDTETSDLLVELFNKYKIV